MLEELRESPGKLGSIIIGVVLYRQQSTYWTKEEFEMIAKCLPDICSKLNEQYADCLAFSCKVFPIEETHDELKTLSFRLDGGTNEDMSASVKEELSRLDFFMGSICNQSGKFLIVMNCFSTLLKSGSR